MKKFVFLSVSLLLTALLVFYLSGCGALLPFIAQILGSKAGFLFIPLLSDNGINENQNQKSPGMILRFTDNPFPAGYARLPGATVTINGVPFVTDNNGYFNIQNIPIGVAPLRVTHPTWAGLEQDVVVSETDTPQSYSSNFKIVPEENTIYLSLGTGVDPPQTSINLEAFATNEEGNSVKANATWTVDKPAQASIGSSGIFSTTNTGTYVVTTTSFDSSASDSVTIIVVDKISTVEGYVQTTYSVSESQSGTPVSGSFVSIKESTQAAVTDPNGYYTIPGVPDIGTPITVQASSTFGFGSTTVTPEGGQTVTAPTIIIGGSGPYPTSYPTTGPTGPTGVTGSWSPQTSGSTDYLQDVDFVDPNSGWAVGGMGTILHTTNGGANWAPQTISDPNSADVSLAGVSFPNPSTGWAVGSGGTILHTSDEGINWSPQISGTTEELFGVFFTDSSTGWAVGANGTILHTADGGGDWVAQSSPTTDWLWAVHFYNPGRGWIAGDNGTILRTEDGGNTWDLVTTPGVTETLYGIFFIDANTGWAVGDMGRIIHSTNSGMAWGTQTSGTTEFLEDVNFISPGTGWIVGGNGTILTTTDAGALWTPETSGTTNNLFGLDFMTGNGWTVGSNGTILNYSP